MVKKRKSNSAQDLIDSLLDDPGENGLRGPKNDANDHDADPRAPQAPPLPKTKSDSSEKSFATMVFEIDPDKADPGHLRVMSDKSHMLEVAKGPMPHDPTQILVKTGDMNASEIRRAPTAVLVSYDKKQDGAPADKTMQMPLSNAQHLQDPAEVAMNVKPIRASNSEVRFQPTAQIPLSATEASLKQSESLRVAQVRIHDLEGELDRLRRENEKLASAGETLRRRTDELLAKTETLEGQSRESEKIAGDERRVLQDQINRKERESIDLRTKLEEAETRLEANFKKIRVRERELEHRLEIVKMESQTLVSTKDDMIMRLKREIDQMRFEIENSKVRSQELFNQFKEKQETMRRVVRALRIALTTLEGEEEKPGFKKAE